MELFGFEIKRSDQNEKEQLQAIVPKTEEDGATEIAPGGMYGTYVDLEGSAKSEGDLVTKYRQMALQPECDMAIEDIINDAIVMEDNVYPVEIILDQSNLSGGIKKRIREEFSGILKHLDFGNKAYEIFRRWYIDGRLYYQIVIDEKDPRAGIKELRYIDPRKIRKVRQQLKERDPKTGATLYKGVKEYYYYNPKGIMKDKSKGVKIAADSICYINCGLIDAHNKMSLGHLHKAMKPLNQLRMLEDATVIYRLSRAPERRIFYIDVGNLPKAKAEQYLRDMMVKHKNKLVYDAQSGEIRDDRRHMTMLEDFWLPRREGGRGTEITTLPGGQNLGEMDDVMYFQKKLYQSLNVPITRVEPEATYTIGRATEISRDEVKFSKFINRIRNRFSVLFDNLLEIQLVLKGIATRGDWEDMKDQISYNFATDQHFEELKNAEVMSERLRLLNELDPLVGKYFSLAWIRKNVLRMTEDEIELMNREIEMEEGDEDSDIDNMDMNDITQPQSQEEEVEPEEEIVIQEKLSDEEKKLVESMTKFYDSFASGNTITADSYDIEENEPS